MYLYLRIISVIMFMYCFHVCICKKFISMNNNESPINAKINLLNGVQIFSFSVPNYLSRVEAYKVFRVNFDDEFALNYFKQKIILLSYYFIIARVACSIIVVLVAICFLFVIAHALRS